MSLKLFRRKNKDGKESGPYYMRGTIAGQRIYESTRLSNRKHAEIVRTRRELELIEYTSLGKSARLTFAQAALTYLESGGEGRFLRPLLLHFGEKTLLADIDSAAVNRAEKAILVDPAPSTVNRQIITPISAVYNLAADDGHVPFRRFRRRKEPQGRLRWLTPEEAERLMENCDKHLLPIVAFLLGSGCRTGEALGLTVENLHLDTNQALIPISKNKELKMVEYPSRTRRLLITSGLPDAGAVFRTPKGNAYKIKTGSGGQIAEAFKKARIAAGLGNDVTPHTLRHTFATWHYAVNKDLVMLMARGGWKKPDMALRYTKLAPSDLPDHLQAYGWEFGAKSVQSVAPIVENINKIRVLR